MLELERRFYQVRCGLPAHIRPDWARIEFVVGSVGAVTMPAHIGAPVKVHLKERPHGRLGPIISHPRSKRWTFLVCPDLPGDQALFAELFRHNVTVAPCGSEIALPSPGASPVGYREWVYKPTDGFRPAGTEVIAAFRWCLSRQNPVTW
ncbi:DNA-directed RNA polymerase subunit beta [Nocardia brasiliensis]|uniref:DNA-directed RNA polymerase subunit beta n=1 Tax=Nocardia brasiliensis TaxID=37326 RepID=UPI001ED9BF76|nr:DNA-directed RNA polymerase subunit beta [Nocardia brasiliensis]